MATKAKRLISIVIPVHNEESNIEWLFNELQEFVRSSSFDLAFEYILIDDGSNDNSLAKMQAIVKQNDDASYLSFSRNFGKEAATSAGLSKAKGDAVIMIDADGQHPLELIGKFIEKWQEGFEVVIGLRQTNSGEGLIKKYGSVLFYKLLNSINDGDGSVSGSTDFRLIDRKVVNEFNKLTEHNRITRGLIDWLGFSKTYVNFSAAERYSGKASYSYRKLFKLALHGFVSQSTKPLQVTGLLGFLVTIISLALTVFIVIENYILSDPLNLHVTGTAMLALFLSFLVGIVLICQWLLALYVESIHSETQNRPLYIVSEESK